MKGTLWKLEEVTLVTGGHPRLLCHELTVPSGVTAVMGPSGAGKTSLLNLLVEFERPTTGRLVVSEENTNASTGGLPLFWVPQNGGLWSHLTVTEHLSAVSPDGVASEKLLDELDLLDRAQAYPGELSAGQQGRLALARALASDASVFIMDEPLGNVDSMKARKYWRVMGEYLQGKSLVFATHSVDTVLREAEHVICLEDGQLQYAGDKETFYERPPTAELAELMGPTNWFEPEDGERWLRDADRTRRSYRPEQLKVELDEASPLCVRASRRGVTVGELDVVDERSDDERTVFHAVNGRLFRAGERIVLRVLSIVLLCCCATVFLPGCSPSSSIPELPATQVSHWSIPAAGKVIPAPRSVRFDGQGEVVVLDNAGRVLVYSSTGELQRQWTMPEFEVGKPEGICVMKDGRIAVTDTHYHRVVFFDRNGKVLGMHGQHGRGPGEFVYPVAITQDPGENYYICEYGDNDRVQKFAVDGTLLLEFGSFGTDPGQFQRPSGIVWHDHQVYVADAINSRIQVFSDTGEFDRVLAHDGQLPSLYYPYDMILGRKGQLFVVEYGAGCVTELSRAGQILSRWGEIGSAKGQLNTPWGLAMNGAGTIVVADTGNRRLVEIQR